MPKKSVRQALNEALKLEMRRDPNVIVMGEDVCGGAGATGEQDAWGGVLGVTKGLYHEFPGRMLDTPISESALIGAAMARRRAGAGAGRRIDVRRFPGRLLRPDLQPGREIQVHVRRQGEDARRLRTMIGAASRAASQHSQCLYNIFTHVPGLKVVVPSTPYDAKGLLIQSIRDDDPVIFCEHKLLYGLEGDVPEESYCIPFGEAGIVRDGDDVTIVALGGWCISPRQAADALQKKGIGCEIIDPRTTSPLDEATILESVEKTGRLVVVDESHPRCGMASDIAGSSPTRRSRRSGLRSSPSPRRIPRFPSGDVLEDLYLPSPAKIEAAVASVMEHR